MSHLCAIASRLVEPVLRIVIARPLNGMQILTSAPSGNETLDLSRERALNEQVHNHLYLSHSAQK